MCFRRAVVVAGVPNQIFTSSINVVFDNTRPITFIEVLDRSGNATGGTATITSGGVGSNSITVTIQSSAAGRGISSHIIIYGALRNATNDIRLGRFAAGNVALSTQRLLIPAVPNQRVTGNIYYFGNRAITMVQGLANNTNILAGNLLSVSGGVGTNSVTLVLESLIGGFIDFTATVFG